MAGLLQIVSFVFLVVGPHLRSILISLAWVAVPGLAVLFGRRTFLVLATCLAAAVTVTALITFFIGGFLFLPIAAGAGLAVVLGTSTFRESTVRRVATTGVVVGVLMLVGTIGGVFANYLLA